jgi:hypothetical protein
VKSQPRQGEIRALLGDGRVSNRAVARQLGVDVRDVARIRKDAGLPAAPRDAWERAPHPKREEILQLLGEGHTDTAIREKTGADLRVIARMRTEGGFGPATITRRGTREHPKDPQIRELLHKGLSNEAIARQLRVDRGAVRRIRGLVGVPSPDRQPLSLEEKWRDRTREVEGGHLEWTGERAGPSRTPVMRYRDKTHTAAVIAFRQRTGRDPVGQVKAECDLPQCVEPAHVEDEPGRTRLREQLRLLLGMGERPKACRRGHDQAEHGRLLPGGVAYCHLCQGHGRTTAEGAR